VIKDIAQQTFALLNKISCGDTFGVTDEALKIIEAQKESLDELAKEFDRLYGAARHACLKLDVSVKRGEAQPAREYEALEEQVERLRPLFEQIVRRRG
jgi:hypothetical protein